MHYLLYLSFFFLFSGSAHDIHLSKSTIHYNEESQSVQVTTKLFLDDLEDALYLVGYTEELKLCTDYEAENGDEAVAQYIATHLKVTIDGKPYEMEYLGKEISEDYMAAWCYLEIPNITSAQKITIANTYLHELFDDQKNIVTIKHNRNNIVDFLMDSEDTKEEVEL